MISTIDQKRQKHLDESQAPPKYVAVIGCGRWGKNLIRNFHALGALSIICDVDAEALEKFQLEYPDVRTTTSLDQVLGDTDIHGVVISTPSHTHFPLAKAALEADKHVYVEKPLATSAVEVEALEELAVKKDLALMVGHLLLYHPAVKRLRQLVETGELGEIKYIQSERLNYNPFRPDKNVMWDLAPHDLSMMCYVLNLEPTEVVSVTGQKTGDDDKVDVVRLALSFPNGIAAHIHNSWVHPSKQVKLIVGGSSKTAVIDDTLPDGKLQLFDTQDNGQPSHTIAEYLSIEPLKLECQHFINCMRFNKKPRTDGINGYNVVKVLEYSDQLLTDQFS